MELFSLHGNTYKLDGGAMFGNAPKALWERWIQADSQNRIRLATRPLLARTRSETILFEAGIGVYMEPKYRERYGVDEPGHCLLQSLEERGVSPLQINRIFLSHLHFDHAGGLLSAWQEGREPELLFPNAKYYVSDQAWERSVHPHVRDRASFIPLLNQKLEASGRLVKLRDCAVFSIDDLQIQMIRSDGHTPGMTCFDLRYGNDRMVYVSDLIPGRFWLHPPIAMGYDRDPELLVDEKMKLLPSLAHDSAWIFYVHDPDYAVSRVKFDEEHRTYVSTDLQRDWTFRMDRS
jgi:glyoxylase-like metal-dependent hydrolase (beta-lactamase superfamily II)